MVTFGLLVRLDSNANKIELEQDQEDLEFQLHKIKRKIYKDIYQHDYKRQLNDLKNDLNRDYNLRILVSCYDVYELYRLTVVIFHVRLACKNSISSITEQVGKSMITDKISVKLIG